MLGYYNEIQPYRCAVLKERIADGLLPSGAVDGRDIREIGAADTEGTGHIHLFAGIGGFALGFAWAGVPPHWRILTGGFPCQDISNAGKHEGIEGSRSGLWSEMVRIIRLVGPEFIVVENVTALLNRGMERVTGDLAASGYDAEWDCLPAAAFGAPHLRDRLWLVAYPAQRGFPVRGKSSRRGGFIARGGEDVANAKQSERWPHVAAGNITHGNDTGRKEKTSGFATCGEDVSNTHRDGQQPWGLHARSREPRETPPESARDSQDVADTQERTIRAGLRANGSDGERRGRFGNGGGPRIFPHTTIKGLEGTDTAGNSRTGRFLGEPGPGGRQSDWWAVEPNVGRVAHGIPARVDRLAALGDSIIPQAAEYLGRRIIQFRSHSLAFS